VTALIGVTSIPRQVATGFQELGTGLPAVLPHETLPEMYLDMVRWAGGTPVVLPVHGDPRPDVIDRLDGLLLTGGGDVRPAEYGRAPATATYGIDVERDRCELDLARAAVSRDLPLLAICRGVQVLNVALGGTLIQDIADEVPGALRHWDPQHWGEGVHRIRFITGSLLAALLGPEITVNSVHHQAIERLGNGLAAAGRSADGVVEAVEAPGRRFVAGVQWHPESLGAGHPSFRLFESLTAAREVRT
jgi:putative glutamine amidotransferase